MLKVLLVEDAPLIQVVHLQMLQNLGCAVDLAINGEQALHCYQNNHYDLIFLDIGLPDMSGIDVCQFIRMHKDTMPIIALTASGIKADCIKAGMNSYLQKPINKDILKTTLIDWVEGYDA